MNGDNIVGLVGIAMCLTLILGGIMRGGWNVRNTPLAKLAAMAAVWVGLIALAAWLFRDYHS